MRVWKERQINDNEQLIDKLKILVIDDAENFTEEMEIFLQKSGFEAYTANTAAAGLTILLDNKIDLLILDKRLPGANGLDILIDVKKEYPELEVIIASGYGDAENVTKALRGGAIDFLHKPFTQAELSIAIDRAVDIIKNKRVLSIQSNKKIDNTNQKHGFMIYLPIKRVKYLFIALCLLITIHVTFLSFRTYDWGDPTQIQSYQYLYGHSPQPDFIGEIHYLKIFPEYSLIFIYTGYFIVMTILILSIKYNEKNTEYEKRGNDTD